MAANETVLENAVIWCNPTMDKVFGSLHIRDGRVFRIERHEALSTGNGSSVDMKGMHVIPGLIDAHRHFFISALLPHHGDASTWTSKDDALGAIEKACLLDGSEHGWVFFSGMDHARWTPPVFPDIGEIDAASHGKRVLVVDTTFHSGMASSQTLIRSGIARESLRCPTDLDIKRDGTPRGTIWEDALSRVLFAMMRDMFKTLAEDEKRRIILEEAERCLKKGLTHVHDPGIPADVQALLKDAQSYTPMKMSWCVTHHDSMFEPPSAKDHEAAIASAHAPMSVKFFLDGAFRTAAEVPIAAGIKAAFRAGKDSIAQKSLWPLRMLFEQKITLRNGRLYMPYLRFEDLDDLTCRARLFTEKGYRVVIHALGNVAARQAAELLRRTRPVGASVEHMLVMDQESLDSFAGCGAVASIQPGFIPYYADAIERQGALPYLKAFPLRSLASSGVDICISSDGPCAADDPLHNMRRAVDRRKADGTMFDPEERISESEALKAATIGASLSMGNRNEGIREGAPATFCVVDGDPFSDSSRVVQTWIDGERAY